MERVRYSDQRQRARDYTQPTPQQGKRPAKAAPTPPATDYCAACYTVLVWKDKAREPHCPRCRDGDKTARKFCRQCLQVHGAVSCTPWVPGGAE